MERESIPLRDYFERLIDERDRRYGQQFEDSKAAVVKSEIALREYKTSANEFRGTLQDQALLFMPRTESENTAKELRSLIEAQAKLIVTLQLGESRGAGGVAQRSEARVNSIAITGIIVSVAVFLTGGLATFIFYLVTKR
jgi:hypothetical protein